MKEELATFVAAELRGVGATDVEVRDLEPILSVGNARQAWSFDVHWTQNHKPKSLGCVMLIKAASSQLETQLGSEFNTMRALHGTGVPLPRVLWLDESGAVLGSPFFASERMPGTADMASILRLSEGDPRGRRLGEDMARVLAALHVVNPDELHVDLPMVTKETAASAQLDYWEDIFERQRMEPHPVLSFAFRWLAQNQPLASRLCVVHGDFRLGNLLHLDDQVVAVLDWEMVHIGDPLEDVAWAYRSVWNMDRHFPFDEFVSRWSSETGIAVDTDALLWHRLFSEVKHSVIALTAARSFRAGASQYIRHADRATNLPLFMGTFLELLP